MEKKYLIAIAVVAVVVIVAAAAFIVMNKGGDKSDDKDKTPEPAMMDDVKSFIDGYKGVFGPFSAEDGTDANVATVSKKNDSERLQYSKVVWTRTNSAPVEYKNLADSLAKKEALMGAEPVVLTVEGMNTTAVKYDVTMGTMSKFTLVYFVAFKDNVLIQSIDNCLYKTSGHATDAELSEVMTAIGKTVGVDSVKVTTPAAPQPVDPTPGVDTKGNEAADKFAKTYSGVFGTYVAKDNSASATISDKPRTVTFTTSDTAKADFEAIKASVSTDPGSYTVVTVDSYAGFDGAFAFMKSRAMGSSEVSMLYITAYRGDLVVDGTNPYQYRNTGFASESDINAMFDALLVAMGGTPISAKAVAAATAFAADYKGVFGTYVATDNSASATISGKPRTVTFTQSDNAKADFEAIKASVSTDPGSYTVVTVDSYAGFDGAFAFMKSRAMGSSEVSMLYITAYKGDMVVDGTNPYQYRNTGFASESDINAMFASILKAVNQ